LYQVAPPAVRKHWWNVLPGDGEGSPDYAAAYENDSEDDDMVY
jgi:hypothetical protein